VDGPIVDIGEEKCRLNLAPLHVSDECVNVRRTRETNAVTPHGVNEFAGLSRHATEIRVEIAVEVRLEYQITRFQVFFTSRQSDEHDVIHHNQTRQVSAGDFGERTLTIARKLRKIPAQFHRMTDIDTRIVLDDG